MECNGKPASWHGSVLQGALTISFLGLTSVEWKHVGGYVLSNRPFCCHYIDVLLDVIMAMFEQNESVHGVRFSSQAWGAHLVFHAGVLQRSSMRKILCDFLLSDAIVWSFGSRPSRIDFRSNQEFASLCDKIHYQSCEQREGSEMPKITTDSRIVCVTSYPLSPWLGSFPE